MGNEEEGEEEDQQTEIASTTARHYLRPASHLQTYLGRNVNNGRKPKRRMEEEEEEEEDKTGG